MSSSRSANLGRPFNTKISVALILVSVPHTTCLQWLTTANIATAVSRIDNLEFLADVIPKTTTYRQYKEKRAREVAQDAPATEKGQRTLDSAVKAQNGVARLPGGQTLLTANGGRTSGTGAVESPMPTVSMMIDPTTEPESAGSGDVDIEMTG